MPLKLGSYQLLYPVQLVVRFSWGLTICWFGPNALHVLFGMSGAAVVHSNHFSLQHRSWHPVNWQDNYLTLFRPEVGHMAHERNWMSYSVFVITCGAHTFDWNIYADVKAHFIPALHQSLNTCTVEPGLSRSGGIQFVAIQTTVTYLQSYLV